MTRHRVAVVGLGKQGWLADQDEGRPRPRSHVSAWQNCPRAELVAVCDLHPRLMANSLEPTSVFFPSLFFEVSEMLESVQQIDIVSVATPPPTHVGIVSALAAAKVRLIVCEKPLAESAGGAQMAVEVCKESGTILLVNHGRRFHPMIRGVKRELDEGRIGKLLWASAWTSGGLWDNQVHMVDLLRFFFGEVGWVYATWKGPCGEQGEEGYVITLLFTSGAYAVIHAGDIRRYVQMDLHLFGEQGAAFLLHYGLDIVWHKVTGTYPLAGGYSGLLQVAMDSAPPTTFLAEMVEHACDVLEGKAEPWCTGEDGLKAVQILEAAERSLSAGSMPIVPGA